MSHLPHHPPQNALSTSPSDESYTGLACFPIGHHITHTLATELLATLRHLRECKVLQPITPAALASLKADLEPLKEAQVFWARRERDKPQRRAVGELLVDLGLEKEAERAKANLIIFTFSNSTRLNSSAPKVWGLFELDMHTRTTYLYVSTATSASCTPGAAGSSHLAPVVLHTFLTSRRCSRLQCFLAEYVLADQAKELSAGWGLPERLQEDIDGLGKEELKELLERLESESVMEAPVLLEKLRVYCEDVLERGEEPGWWVEEESDSPV